MPKVPFWIFILLAALYFSAVRLDVMDIDASQYAEISREMMQTDNWLHVYDRGMDYLDKPPFLFWASALSMKLFGVNNFGYRFPSILFALLGIYAAYRLARRLYDEPTGRVAALILGVSQGMFLWTNDVRTDTILMGSTAAALWLIADWQATRKLWQLLASCAFIAIGMMTKGPIALMVPVFCFASHWVLQRNWKAFVRPQYLLDIVVIAVLLVPMSTGLYQQFDLHPEKMVNGQTGVSGLRFFYWSQSFGRITGESPWNNNAPFSFLYESMLWAFLPWILLFTAALVINVVVLVRQRFKLQPGQEWISTGGFLLTYLSMASSNYQLPHYIFIAFPLAAVTVAALLKDFAEGKYAGVLRVSKPVHVGISVLLLVAALLTFVYVFKTQPWVYVVFGAGIIIYLVLAFRKALQWKWFWLPVAAMMVANAIMTHHFYYELFKFQAGSQIGHFIKQKNIKPQDIAYSEIGDPLNCLHFYAGDVLPFVNLNDSTTTTITPYLIANKDGLQALSSRGYTYDIVKQGDYYKVSELTPKFLNPDTRDSAVRQYYIVRVKE